MPRRRLGRGSTYHMRLTFPDAPNLCVWGGSDGKYYSGHSQLRGPFDSVSALYAEAFRLFDPRCKQPVVTQGGPSTRRHDRALPAPSPLTEDLPQPPPPFDNLVEDVVESTSALTLLEPDVLSSEEESLEEFTPQAVSHKTIDHPLPSVQSCPASSGQTIWIRRPPDWYHMFCIRMDREGSFHIYPDLGGPFQSLKAAEDAIDHYVNGLPRPARCDGQDKVTSTESQIRRIIFYPDGTPKRGPNSPGKKSPNYQQHRLVQVILDQYNDDHNLSGGHAHELDDDVKFNWFDENNMSYIHFNFMTKIKDTADGYPGTGNLFFAELKQMQIKGDYVISCCCIVGHDSIGPCFGCIRPGSTEVTHPSNINAYTSGRVDCRYFGFGGDPCSDSDDDEDTLKCLSYGLSLWADMFHSLGIK